LPESANFCLQCGYPLGTPKTGNPFAAGRSARQTLVEVAARPAVSLPQPLATDAHQALRQFLPAELAAKLSAAREQGQKIGERRVVTMLFCDVKGSTAAAEGLDPEDWTEIINAAFEHMIKPVYAYEGTVARLMGDGILAFFGAPIAHEDDPQRAVLAALDIVAQMAPFRQKIAERWHLDFNVRVGINTGMVVVGAVGSDLRMEYTAMGDAINLAARMEQTAEPGTVQIAHDTYRLVQGLFEVEALGAIDLKGRTEPEATYRVIGRSSMPGHRRGIKGLEAAMVGREKELSALLSALAATRQGIGRIICVIGEAGFGKSRLIEEAFAQWQKAEAGAVPDGRPGPIGAECYVIGSLAFESTHPFAIWQRLIRRLIDVPGQAPAEMVREQLAALASTFAGEDQEMGLRALATLFGVSAGSGRPALEGEQFKRALLQTMRQMWRQRFADHPAVLVFDDLHWGDPASIDLLLQLLPVVDASPTILICAFRPDRQSPSWRIKTSADADFYHRYNEIFLHPLTPEESDEMVGRLLNGAEMPDTLRHRIQERAGGNPFFIEEVVRELIDSGGLKPVERVSDGKVVRDWQFAPEQAVFNVPENLKALLTARLDRLDARNRHTLELASVIGRSFAFRVLAAVAESEALDPAEVEQELILLVRREMIEESARVPELEYRFRSPLTQELVYRTILIKRRREFHRRVGEAMEALFSSQVAAAAPRLAYHFDLAGEERALGYYAMAGDQAFRLYANKEATEHYARALQLALEADEPAPEQIDHLFRRRGRALELDGDFQGALVSYQKMEKEAQRRGLPRLELAALILQGTIRAGVNDQYDAEAATALSQRSLEMALEQADREAEARIQWNLLNVYRFTDRLDQAARAGERAVELARALELREQLAYALNDLSDVYFSTEKREEATAALHEAEVLWRDLDNKPMLADILGGAASMYTWTGNFAKAISVSAEAFAISQSIGNGWGMSYSQSAVSQAHWELGDVPRAITAGVSCVHYADLAGFGVGQTFGRAFVSIMYAELGYSVRAQELMQGALSRLDEIGLTFRYGLEAAGQLVAALTGQAGVPIPGATELEMRPNVDSFMRMMTMRAWSAAALIREDWPAAEQITGMALAHDPGKSLRAVLPMLLYVRSRALQHLGRGAEAMELLRAARGEAEAMGSRWILWQILAALADLEPAAGAAQALRTRALDIVQGIADRISSSGALSATTPSGDAGSDGSVDSGSLLDAAPPWDELRQGFLARMDVSALMAHGREIQV
jgi:class 3 adenylate cyclase/predicted ATPase